MSNLILDSLEIKNFRTFDYLQISQLGRVNLFVGKNNVGKSSLLEALWLYARRGAPSIIWRILEARNESRRSRHYFVESLENENRLAALRYLFHGRKDVKEQKEPITIGPIDVLERQLIISMALEGGQQLSLFHGDEPLSDDFSSNVHLSITYKKDEINYVVDQAGRQYNMTNILSQPSTSGDQCVFVPANGLGFSEIGRLWDSIALTDQEQNVIAALRIIAPDVERASLVGSLERSSDAILSQQRIPIVKVTAFDEPVPLRSLGEGMNRMFGIALAMANAENGILLIDEIESGLHYSIQSDMWRLVFALAHQLNVQVFATTHSWDCITAFQEAAREDVHEEGLLIRLERRNDDVHATLFDEEELAIATREQIEVR